MLKESRWQKLLDSIEGVIDSLPLQYGTNWSRLIKNRSDRSLAREFRKKLL
jgi:hypothetical protein